jgi:hypothetical protein
MHATHCTTDVIPNSISITYNNFTKFTKT